MGAIRCVKLGSILKNDSGLFTYIHKAYVPSIKVCFKDPVDDTNSLTTFQTLKQ